MTIESSTLLVTILTLLVAILAAAFAFRQIARGDRARRDEQARQEEDDIIEWARITRTDMTTPIITRVEPIPEEWRRDFRRQRQKGQPGL